MKKISFFISTLFYFGYFPKAPGTIGSFVSLPVIFFICNKFGLQGLILTIIISFVISLFCIKEVLKYTKHDPSFVVIDEFVGQSVTFLLIADTLKNNTSLVPYIIGFILFRIFDVIKPFPVDYADKKIKNALGVVLDDVFAGFYATIVLYSIMILLKGF